MNATQDLRGIHLPEPVSWWPLAPGWWLLMAMILFIALLIFQKWRRSKQFRARNQAIDEALMMLKGLDEVQDESVIKDLSRILRRVAVTLYGRKETAGLVGEEWLTFLDQKSKSDEFSQGLGRVFAALPYQNKEVKYSRKLIALAEKWVRQQRK
ncbi:MAG: Unknown protein [uncultured Thiotrichaceae bacterium]|uniref:DUF4381 domain-containing protein n=1 Tax=uncultured Thiotrichaceae bacterium TaxID=298394 RepID=A0A6S6UBE5_9GAMM|nr:MAG: Unknown protein [uncultured Thiotrichaceae bacterium]